MENPPFEDVFPIENGDFPLLCLFTGGYLEKKHATATVFFGRTPANQLRLVVVVPINLPRFDASQVVVSDFWTINSMNMKPSRCTFNQKSCKNRIWEQLQHQQVLQNLKGGLSKGLQRNLQRIQVTNI